MLHVDDYNPKVNVLLGSYNPIAQCSSNICTESQRNLIPRNSISPGLYGLSNILSIQIVVEVIRLIINQFTLIGILIPIFMAIWPKTDSFQCSCSSRYKYFESKTLDAVAIIRNPLNNNVGFSLPSIRNTILISQPNVSGSIDVAH